MLSSLFSSRAALLGAVLACLSACSDDNHGQSVVDAGPTQGRVPVGDGCSTPNQGCPCTDEAAVAPCAETVSRQGDILTCREGERTCVDGKWGACVGDETSQMFSDAPEAPGAQEQGQGATKPCLDKCDPYCQKIADTPADLPLENGAGGAPELVADANGLTLYTDGFTGSNCPDITIAPDPATITITKINDDGTVIPDGVDLQANCGTAVIAPSWSTDQPDRSAVNLASRLQVFSGIAGDINVTASSLIDTATSVVNVKVNINEVTGISDPIQTAFEAVGDTADPGKTLYPYKNTVFPLDLTAPVVQWQTGGTAAANVQVALRYPVGSATPSFWYSKIYAGEPNEGTIQTTGAPSWQIPQAVWTAFARTAKGANAEIIIQRKTNATTYQEMKIPVTFSTAALRGTVYYTQYQRRLYKADGSQVASGQTNLPTTFNALAPAGVICPVGNNTHATDKAEGGTTVAIDMSKAPATILKPFGTKPGCPVCHSLSANGKVYVSGSQFLQSWAGGDRTGFVNDITLNAAGTPQFTPIGIAPNYASFRTAQDWDSRGFADAALTPDGALALQGFYWWGNTQDGTVANNLSTDRSQTLGGQIAPMFFVPTAVNGASVKAATTSALAATRSGNVLTASAAGLLPSIDGLVLSGGDSLLVKNQATAADNGIYVVTDIGGDITTATTFTATASSVAGTNTAAKAFDNSTSSRWESASGAGTQWLQLDLGSSQAIAGVKIVWEAANARDYKIQGSNDATTWTDLTTQTGVGGPVGRTDTLTGLTGTYRYVRVYCTLRNNTYGYSIYEMDVLAPAAGTSYKLTRRSDAQTGGADGTIKAKWEVRVTRGTVNYAKVFKLTAPTTDPVINTDGMTFADTGADPLPVMATPTISPDGTKLAYVNGNADTVSGDSTAWRKGLTMVDFVQATRKISNKKRLLNNWDGTTGGVPIKWPFFEPDSRSLLFVQTSTDEYCRSGGSTSDPHGRACFESVYGNMAPTTRGHWPGSLYSIDTAAATPSTTKVELAKLNDAEDASDADKAYQPTVLPFESGGYHWVIFTSPRSYGNQLNQVGTDFTCGASMLWVGAVDVMDPTSPTYADRSHPAFFLPGQNALPIVGKPNNVPPEPEHYINERGYLVPTPCKTGNLSCETSDECCAGTQCRVDSMSMTGLPNKVCKAPGTCSAVGDACLTSADCCPGSPCTAQKCQAIPAYAPATYTRTYEATCEFGFQPRWGLFLFHLTTGSSSRIGLGAKTAVTEAELAAAPSVNLGDSTKDNYGGTADERDVGKLLEAAKQPFSSAFLQISITLYPSANGSVAPILHDWEQRYTCQPAE
jgi:hypothetical protein